MPRIKKRHICDICKKEFKKKNNLEYHLNKKFPCKSNEESNITLYEKNEILDNNLECNICSKVFSSKSNLNKHIRGCKKKYSVYNNSIEKDIKKYINEYISESKNIVINNTTINNTINGNVIINNYGCEKLDYIDTNFLLNLFNKPEKSLPTLIKEIHFNEVSPINRNIYLSNNSDKVIYTYKNGKWLLNGKDKTLNELIAKNFDRIDDYYEYNKGILDDTKKIKYKKYADKYDNCLNRDEINKDVTNIIKEGSKKISFS
jgi:hypothetical protein